MTSAIVVMIFVIIVMTSVTFVVLFVIVVVMALVIIVMRSNILMMISVIYVAVVSDISHCIEWYQYTLKMKCVTVVITSGTLIVTSVFRFLFQTGSDLWFQFDLLFVRLTALLFYISVSVDLTLFYPYGAWIYYVLVWSKPISFVKPIGCVTTISSVKPIKPQTGYQVSECIYAITYYVNHSKLSIYCHVIGVGTQFLCIASGILVMALLGMFNVHRHGAINSAAILLYALTSCKLVLNHNHVSYLLVTALSTYLLCARVSSVNTYTIYQANLCQHVHHILCIPLSTRSSLITYIL